MPRFMHGHEVDPVNGGNCHGSGSMRAIYGGSFEEKNGSPILAGGVVGLSEISAIPAAVTGKGAA